jgi:phage shock protein A
MVKRIKMADQSSADNAARLDRIEEKIDRMAEAIIALARAEEKIEALTRSFNDQNLVIANLAQRIDDVEGIVQANTSTVNVINKIFWIIISAAAVAVSGMLFLQVQ